MYKNFYFFKFYLIVILCLNTISCVDMKYCEELKRRAIDDVLIYEFEKWIDLYISEKKYLSDKAISGGGMWPGEYWANTEFDWGGINYRADSQVRLVGASVSDDYNGFINNIKSVYFGEKSRYGILIKLEGSEDYGVPEPYLTRISENVAVVCRERD